MRDVKTHHFLKHGFIFHAASLPVAHFSADLWETLETLLPVFPSLLLISTKHIQEGYFSTPPYPELLRKEEEEII